MSTISLYPQVGEGRATGQKRVAKSASGDSPASCPGLNEAAIWQAFKAGDRAAFAQIYERYFAELYAYGLKIIRDEEQTQDCLCDFFVYLWDHREGLTDLEQLKYYLLKAFRHRAVRHLRKQQNLLQREKRYAAQGPQFHFSQAELIEEGETERLRKVYTAALLNQLSDRQREIVFLRFYENLSIKEIAAVLDLKEQSVLNHLQRIFKRLRSAFPNFFPELLTALASLLLTFV